MSLISRNSTQVVGLRRRASETVGWGETSYDPAPPDAPLRIRCVYEPRFSDSGRDGSTVFRGRVLTKTSLSLGDLIIPDLDSPEDAQEVTEVAPLYGFDGSIDFYEALL